MTPVEFWCSIKEEQPQQAKRLQLLFFSGSVVSHSFVNFFQLQPSRLLCPWDSPGKNTEVGCHFLLQGIFPTQGSNQCLLHWQVDSLLLSHLGGPKRLLTSLFSNYIYCETEFPSHLATKTIYCNLLNTKAGMRISMNQYEYQQIKLKNFGVLNILKMFYFILKYSQLTML